MVTITTRSNTLTIICDGFRVTTGKPVLTKESVAKPISTFIEEVVKEVSRQPSYIQKRFIKTALKTLLLSLPLLATTKAHAQTPVGFPILEKSSQSSIIPTEISGILMEIIFAAGALSVALAMLCLIVAGVYRMIGQTEKAQKWSVDIIKGLGQVLLAPIVILVLVTLASLVFKNVPGLERFF